MLNWLSRSLMKLSFSSTSALSYEPWYVPLRMLFSASLGNFGVRITFGGVYC
jgi:hypothetical protein